MDCIVMTGAPPAGAYFRNPRRSGMTGGMGQSTSDSGGGGSLVAIMEAVAGGDREAFRALYERTSAKLYGVCVRLLGSEPEAQDVLQDVYVTVWRKASQFDARKASAITWLATLARNRSIDRLRARRASADDLDSAQNIVDDRPSAFEVFERDQDAARLTNCLDELEERARLVIRSAFFEGVTYADLAAREDVPLGTMKSWIRRGLLRLRGCLER